MTLLSVNGLFSRYSTSKGPVYAVDDVDFQLDTGESLGIAGESACGKSTLGLSLIRMLTGGESSGKIIFDDKSILDLSDSEFDEKFRWKKISMIFQGAMNSLDPVFTIHQQFNEILKQHNFDGNADKLILDSITSVNLDEDVLKKYPHELSGGMKQRVIIAMALILKPQFVVADEPTTALDVVIQDQILKEIKKVQELLGLSLIYISHDIAVIAEMTDKMAVMYAGSIVEKGPTSEIFANPQHSYTKSLLASTPSVVGDKVKLNSLEGEPPSLIDQIEGCSFAPRCPNRNTTCHPELDMELVEVGPDHYVDICSASRN